MRDCVVLSCAWLLALALAPTSGAFGQSPSTQGRDQQPGSAQARDPAAQPGNASNAKSQGQSDQPSNAGNAQHQSQPGQSSKDNSPRQGQGQTNQPANGSNPQGQSHSNTAADANKPQSRSWFTPGYIKIGSWITPSFNSSYQGATGSQGKDPQNTWMYTGQMNDQPQGVLFSWVDQASRNSGMTLAPADAALRAHLKLPEDQGLIVTAIEPGSLAAAVGIQPNDVLLRVASHTGLSLPTAKPEDLEAALKAFGESPITIDLLRGGQKTTVRVQPMIHASLGPVRPEPLAYWIGVTVAPVEPALRSQLQLPENQGLLVTEVDKFGPAARAGVRPFDILRKFDGVDVVDQAGLTKLVQSRADKVVALELLREGKSQEVKVVPQRRQAQAFNSNINLAQNDAWVSDVVLNNLNVVYPNVNYTTIPNQGLWVTNEGNMFRVNPPAAADGNATVDRKIDELSKQIQELRQAIEALAKSQAKK